VETELVVEVGTLDEQRLDQSHSLIDQRKMLKVQRIMATNKHAYASVVELRKLRGDAQRV